MGILSLVSDQYPNLKILRIFLAQESRDQRAVFELVVRGTLVGRLSVSPTELGLPLTGEEASDSRVIEGLKLPGYIRRSISAGFGDPKADGEPIWISIDRPSGFLPMMCWERLLRQDLKVPLLRLPHLRVKPFMPRESLDIAICFACPVDNGRQADLANVILKAAPGNAAKIVRLYIFANQLLSVECRALQDKLPGLTVDVFNASESATVRGTAELAESETAPVGTSTIRNAWLLWMLSALGSRSVDIVQFVNHSSQVEEQGQLNFAPLEDSKEQRPFQSNAGEISEFLSRCGAWAVSLISPPTNKCESGLRMLQDQIAWLRPGPVCLYSLDEKYEAKELELVNRFILTRNQAPLPMSDDLSLVCHPEGVMPGSALGTLLGRFIATVAGGLFKTTARNAAVTILQQQLERLLQDHTLASRLNSQLESQDNTPAPIASAQRKLEQSLAQAHDPDEAKSVQEGADEALKLLVDWIHDYVNRSKTEQSGSGKLSSLFRRQG